MWPLEDCEEVEMEFLSESVGFQSGTVWSFYFWIFVFFVSWGLIMLRAGMNKGKQKD